MGSDDPRRPPRDAGAVPVSEPGDGERAELLLHSLAALREIVLPVLDAVAARDIVEVGGEGGGFTTHLAQRAARVGGRIRVVDPAPSAALEQLARTVAEVELVRAPSPDALRALAPADAYLLDGDHNYATVTGELRAVDELATDTNPVVVLHDVGWPCARRDQYYRPDALPAEMVHPYTYERGVRPGSPGVVDGGFSGAGEFAYATREGGPRNGVLTAVDDFLAASPRYRFVRVPSIFGLGILFPGDAPYAGALTDALAWCDESPFLARLEANRIDLYLRATEAARGLEVVARQRDEAITVLESLRRELRAVADSRRVRLVDAIPRPGRAGLRDVLRSLADGLPPPDRGESAE
jgi:hypothetical protein